MPSSDNLSQRVQQDDEIAEVLVDADALLPDRNGAVPLYTDHAPDTHLPMWRCPCCGESAPTMNDLWRLYKRRERLIDEKNEYEYPSEEWDAYQEGIKETNRRISRLTGALPSEIASWVRDQVDPIQWSNSELNPDNYRGGSSE